MRLKDETGMEFTDKICVILRKILDDTNYPELMTPSRSEIIRNLTASLESLRNASKER